MTFQVVEMFPGGLFNFFGLNGGSMIAYSSAEGHPFPQHIFLNKPFNC
jgi:hypothetical protein